MILCFCDPQPPLGKSAHELIVPSRKSLLEQLLLIETNILISSLSFVLGYLHHVLLLQTGHWIRMSTCLTPPNLCLHFEKALSILSLQKGPVSPAWSWTVSPRSPAKTTKVSCNHWILGDLHLWQPSPSNNNLGLNSTIALIWRKLGSGSRHLVTSVFLPLNKKRGGEFLTRPSQAFFTAVKKAFISIWSDKLHLVHFGLSGASRSFSLLERRSF